MSHDDKMANAVEVTEHPVFGRIAIATRSFRIGEVVINERPLLHSSLSDPDPVVSLYSITNLLPGSDTILPRAQAYACASPEVRQCVQREFHIPDKELSKDRPRVQLLKAVAHLAAGPLNLSEQELLRALAAFQVNAHGYEGGGSVLYRLASKLTHTCGRPNTMYLADNSGGFGLHVALEDIQPGDLLTTSYIHDAYLITSTQTRQKMLRENFLFQCSCSRCTNEADFFRGLPCPSCLSPSGRSREGRLKRECAIGRRPLPGIMFFDPRLVHTGKPWVCHNCGIARPDCPDDLGLPIQLDGRSIKAMQERHSIMHSPSPLPDASNVEASLERQVVQLEMFLDHFQALPSMSLCYELLEDCQTLLGPAHWTSHKMLLTTAECNAGRLRGLIHACSNPSQAVNMKQMRTDMAGTLDAIEDDMTRVLEWLDHLPPSPTRHHTPDLVGTALKNIANQLVKCAMDESLSTPPFRQLRRQMVLKAQDFINIARQSHEVKNNPSNPPEALRLMATPGFRAICSESAVQTKSGTDDGVMPATAAPAASAYAPDTLPDAHSILESFLPPTPPNTAGGRRGSKNKKSNKAHKKKGH